MDLTFQLAMQYCSLQTLFSSPDTSTNEHHFFFVLVASFFLKLLALLSFPVEYWTSSHLGSSSSHVISFCLFILFMGFLQQKYWGPNSDLPFSPSLDHVLSDLSTMTHPSLVALHDIARGFIELCKPLHQDKAVIDEKTALLKLFECV